MKNMFTLISKNITTVLFMIIVQSNMKNDKEKFFIHTYILQICIGPKLKARDKLSTRRLWI